MKVFSVGGNILTPGDFRIATASTTFAVSNSTESKVVFTITGVVYIEQFWGVVTTAISSNHTAGHIRTNDQTATLDLSEAATGATLSSFEAGSMVFKESLLAVALNAKRANVAFIEEDATAGIPNFTGFFIGKKSGAVTTLDYRYTSTNTPATGVIKWYAKWYPRSDDGNVA